MDSQVHELELVSTEDLIKELAARHKELIVIREHKKSANEDRLFVKTEGGFDLMEATEMLQAAHWQLIYSCIGKDEK